MGIIKTLYGFQGCSDRMINEQCIKKSDDEARRDNRYKKGKNSSKKIWRDKRRGLRKKKRFVPVSERKVRSVMSIVVRHYKLLLDSYWLSLTLVPTLVHLTLYSMKMRTSVNRYGVVDFEWRIKRQVMGQRLRMRGESITLKENRKVFIPLFYYRKGPRLFTFGLLGEISKSGYMN